MSNLSRPALGTEAAAVKSDPKALPTVAVVVPVLNEAHVLEKSIATLLGYLREDFPYPAHVIIADNGSTDGTADVARRLAEAHDDVRMISLSVRGRGRALRAAWTASRADIVAYTDVDLSTELPALERLCRGLHEGGYDIATGSRLLPGSRIVRCFKREVLSRGYNLFLRWVLWTHFSDAQCGFKAVSRRVVDKVVPLIQNQHWFFDTELLVLGEKFGFRILDVPVRWVEDPDSRVKIASTVWEDVKGVFRLRWQFWRGRLRLPERPMALPPVAAPPAATLPDPLPSAQPTL
jgi:glycosyltransferase involved in cell wall biosynthesis